ncbi:MAG: hypothetical protein M3198_16940 [Actinomycetota bacterium]|nr:hypothetical protein [Actinomycetota bacterium]
MGQATEPVRNGEELAAVWEAIEELRVWCQGLEQQQARVVATLEVVGRTMRGVLYRMAFPSE